MGERLTTVAEVDRYLAELLEQKAKAERVADPTPESAAIVGHCDASIDELLAMRWELTSDPAGS